MKKIVYLFGFIVVCIGFGISCSNDKDIVVSDKTAIEIESQNGLNLTAARIHPDDKIGGVVSGRFVITENLSGFYAMLNDGISQSIGNYIIKEAPATPGTYILTGKSSDNTIKVSVKLDLDHNIFYLNTSSVSGGRSFNKTVCTGCTIGCSPDVLKNPDGTEQNICTPCETYPYSNCTKTESKEVLALARSLASLN